MSQFLTALSSREKCSIDLTPKSVKISNFLSILYSKPLREHKKPSCMIRDRVRISKYDSPFMRVCEQVYRGSFETVEISSREPPTSTVKDEQDEIILGKKNQKELIKVVQQWNCLPKSWFLMLLHKPFHKIHSVLLQTFYQSNWIWKVNGRLRFRKNLTHQCTRMSQRKSLCFLVKNFQSRLNFTLWNPVCILLLGILMNPLPLSLKKDTITAKAVSQLKCLEELKFWDLPWNWKIWPSFL